MMVLYQTLVYFSLYVSACKAVLKPLGNVDVNTNVHTKGMVVTDMDQDGIYEVIVAVYNGPNIILQYASDKHAYVDIGVDRQELLPIRDPNGQTLSLCACDLDGDGTEEVFIVNEKTLLDTVPGAPPNRLIKHANGTFVDLLTEADNVDLAYQYSGDFVTCIDHDGDGSYALLLGTYRRDGSGEYKLYAVDTSKQNVVLQDISEVAGLDTIKDGTGAVIGPIINDAGLNDILVTNSNHYYENSNTYRHNNTNVLYRNQGIGHFTPVTKTYFPQDDSYISYGAAIADINGDQMIDILTCSMYGPARKYIRNATSNVFKFGRDDDFTRVAGCMNLLVADFDNDGRIDVLKDNILNDNRNYNGVFEVSTGDDFDVSVTGKKIGKHLRNVNIQGLTVADLNGDGLPEMFVSHKQHGGSTLSVYQEDIQTTENSWLRILPLTKEGAPARGSKVTLTLGDYHTMTSVVGGGCSSSCQTEPLVHFGLGNMTSRVLEVTWPDGHKIKKFLNDDDTKKTLQISYSGQVVKLHATSMGDGKVSTASFVKPTMAYALLHVFINALHCVLGSM